MNTPKTKTSNDYKKAIQARYEDVRNDLYSGSLLEPTPALLKQLCILKIESCSKIDLEVFDRFFVFKSGENKMRQIENFDTDKFRPLCNFLKGKTKSIQHLSLEVIAVLIDFEARPFNLYLKSNYEKKDVEKKTDSDIKAQTLEGDTTDFLPEDVFIKKTPRKKQLTLLLLATLYIALISFLMSFVKYPSVNTNNQKNNKEYTMRIDYHFKTVKNDTIIKDEMEAGFLSIPKPIIKTEDPEIITSTFYNEAGTIDLWYPDSIDNITTKADTPSLNPDTINSFKIAKEIMENEVLKKKILKYINDYQIVNVEVEIGVSYIRM